MFLLYGVVILFDKLVDMGCLKLECVMFKGLNISCCDIVGMGLLVMFCKVSWVSVVLLLE